MATLLARSQTNAGAPDEKGRVLVDPRAVIGKRQRKQFVPRSLQRMLGPVLLIALWQLLSTTGVFDERTVPPPTTVLSTALKLIADGSLQEHLLTSLLRVGYGVAFG